MTHLGWIETSKVDGWNFFWCIYDTDELQRWSEEIKSELFCFLGHPSDPPIKLPSYNDNCFKPSVTRSDVKQNFKNQKQSPWCLTCGLFPETQGHLLQCPEIVTKFNYLKGIASKLDENDVYSSIAKQEIIVNIYSDIIEERENIINNVIEWETRNKKQEMRSKSWKANLPSDVRAQCTLLLQHSIMILLLY